MSFKHLRHLVMERLQEIDEAKLRQTLRDSIEDAKYLGELLKDKLEDVGETIKDGAADLTEKVVEWWEDTSFEELKDTAMEQVINKTEAITNMIPEGTFESESLLSSVNITDITLRLGASVAHVVQERPLVLVGVGLAVLLSQPQLLVWILHTLGLGVNGPILASLAAYVQSQFDGRIPPMSPPAAAAVAAGGAVLAAASHGGLTGLD